MRLQFPSKGKTARGQENGESETAEEPKTSERHDRKRCLTRVSWTLKRKLILICIRYSKNAKALHMVLENADELPKYSWPKTSTNSGMNFYQSHHQIVEFHLYVTDVTERHDIAFTAGMKAYFIATDDPRQNFNEKDWEERKFASIQLKKHVPFFNEVMLCRHVDNMLNYFSGLLYEIFTSRPDTLRSSQKIEVSHVLEHASMESFIQAIAWRQVEELSYRSFKDLVKYFQEKFGLEILKDEAVLDALSESVEIRNLSAHNRCVVNKKFIAKSCVAADALGKRLTLSIDYVSGMVDLIFDVVHGIDKHAIEHLSLPTVGAPAPPQGQVTPQHGPPAGYGWGGTMTFPRPKVETAGS